MIEILVLLYIKVNNEPHVLVSDATNTHTHGFKQTHSFVV